MRQFGCDLSCQHLDAFGCYILRMFIPDPIKLVRRPNPFDDPEWIYEINTMAFEPSRLSLLRRHPISLLEADNFLVH